MHVAVHAHPQRRRGCTRQREPFESRCRIAHDPSETRQARACDGECPHRVTAVGASNHRCVRQRRLEPSASHVADILSHCDQRMSSAVACRRRASRLEIGMRCVEPEPELGGGALYDGVVLEATRPQRDVGLASSEVEVACVGEELDDQPRVLLEQRRHQRREHARDEPLGRRDAHGATDAFILATHVSLGRDGVVLHPLSVFDELGSRTRQNETVRASVKEHGPQSTLERCDASADRRLRDGELAGRGGEGAVPRDHQHEAEIVPVHAAPYCSSMHDCMGGIQNRGWCGRAAAGSVGTMSRRRFFCLLGGSTYAMACAASVPATHLAGAPTAPRRPREVRGVVFDLFTLFDPRGVDQRVEELLPGASGFAAVWKTRLFEYSWIRAASGQYADFEELVRDSLSYASRSQQVVISDTTRYELQAAFTELRPWPDCREVLQELAGRGLRLAPLANFTPAMIEGLLTRGGVREYFDALISTDRARTYKPDPRAYALGERVLGLSRQQIAFAAFGGWDAAGASWYGYPTFWVNRLGAVPEELIAADAVGPDLRSLTRWILEENRG